MRPSLCVCVMQVERENKKKAAAAAAEKRAQQGSGWFGWLTGGGNKVSPAGCLGSVHQNCRICTVPAMHFNVSVGMSHQLSDSAKPRAAC